MFKNKGINFFYGYFKVVKFVKVYFFFWDFVCFVVFFFYLE